MCTKTRRPSALAKLRSLSELSISPQKARLKHPESWRERIAVLRFLENNDGFGFHTLQAILHECVPGCAHGGFPGQFHEKVEPLNKRGIEVALAVIQWLGSNVGFEFLRQFQLAVEAEAKKRHERYVRRHGLARLRRLSSRDP